MQEYFLGETKPESLGGLGSLDESRADTCVFQYNSTPITFAKGDSLMVNATEMAKPFGKKPAKWLELPSTRDFLSALQTVRKSDSLIKTVEGRSGGTWFHEDVALEFARWLSPGFAIWCNDRIKELLTRGMVALNGFGVPKTFAEALQLAADQQRKIEEQTAQIKQLRIQSEYCEIVLRSKDAVTVSQVAADYGMSAKKFNKLLNSVGVQHKVSGQWLLYAKYLEKGYTTSETYTFSHSDGRIGTSILTKWTQKGRLFLYDILKDNDILPLIERKSDTQAC